MNTNYIIPCLALSFANIIFWYKGNSKAIYGLDWSPFKWWLYTSLITNYITLHAWWKLIELSNVWKAGVTWGLCSLFVDLILNTIYFGFNLNGIIALAFCACSAFFAHKT